LSFKKKVLHFFDPKKQTNKQFQNTFSNKNNNNKYKKTKFSSQPTTHFFEVFPSLSLKRAQCAKIRKKANFFEENILQILQEFFYF